MAYEGESYDVIVVGAAMLVLKRHWPLPDWVLKRPC